MITRRHITDRQFQYAAQMINCEVAVIKTVAAVESKGSGYYSDGRIKILFEPHIFWRELSKIGKLRLTLNRKDFARYKHILYEKPGTFPYGLYKHQWPKLELAREIDVDAANKSASWGRFQQMGQYHEECGFKTVGEMITAYEINEFQHLLGFVRMIKARGLDDELRRKDWNEFALRYNGANYKINDYHIKLPATYKKLKPK